MALAILWRSKVQVLGQVGCVSVDMVVEWIHGGWLHVGVCPEVSECYDKM